MADFTNKVALVTGGGSGIGRATALAFAHEGAKVVVAGRREAEGQETVQLIEKAGGEALFVQTDVTDEAAVKALVEKTVAAYGRLDYAFNNAGTEGKPGPLVEQTEDSWNVTIDGNLKSAWLSMKYELQQMNKQGSGAIVNNASIFAQVAAIGFGVYTAAKHGLVGLTKAAALEYAQAGIRVNAVSPGAIATPMGDRNFGSEEAYSQFMAPKHPVGRLGQPQEIAEAVIWLCSDKASFVTGQELGVDGGYTAQ